eukprot:8053582-Lingulodinium_polyedra.AAC.1
MVQGLAQARQARQGGRGAPQLQSQQLPAPAAEPAQAHEEQDELGQMLQDVFNMDAQGQELEAMLAELMEQEEAGYLDDDDNGEGHEQQGDAEAPEAPAPEQLVAAVAAPGQPAQEQPQQLAPPPAPPLPPEDELARLHLENIYEDPPNSM